MGACLPLTATIQASRSVGGTCRPCIVVIVSVIVCLHVRVSIGRDFRVFKTSCNSVIIHFYWSRLCCNNYLASAYFLFLTAWVMCCQSTRLTGTSKPKKSADGTDDSGSPRMTRRTAGLDSVQECRGCLTSMDDGKSLLIRVRLDGSVTSE